MTLHPKGFVVFAAFAAVLTLAVDSRLGLLAVAAWAVIEVLMWSGVAGVGRGHK